MNEFKQSLAKFLTGESDFAQLQPRDVRGVLGLSTQVFDQDQDNIDQVTTTLQDTWDRLQRACAEGEFEACTGPLCAWCPFVAHCPEGQAEVQQRARDGRVRHDAPGLAVVAKAS